DQPGRASLHTSAGKKFDVRFCADLVEFEREIGSGLPAAAVTCVTRARTKASGSACEPCGAGFGEFPKIFAAGQVEKELGRRYRRDYGLHRRARQAVENFADEPFARDAFGSAAGCVGWRSSRNVTADGGNRRNASLPVLRGYRTTARRTYSDGA